MSAIQLAIFSVIDGHVRVMEKAAAGVRAYWRWYLEDPSPLHTRYFYHYDLATSRFTPTRLASEWLNSPSGDPSDWQVATWGADEPKLDLYTTSSEK